MLAHLLQVWRNGARTLPHCSTQPRKRALCQVLSQSIPNCFMKCNRWTYRGVCVAPVVSSTVRNAPSSVEAVFWYNHKLSPFHEQGRLHLLPDIRSLLKAYDNVDPPTLQQKAITSKLQWCMLASTGVGTPKLQDTFPAAITSLTISSAFFFAKCSCEFSMTRKPGRTPIGTLQYVLFRDRSKHIVPHHAPDLLAHAEYVMIIFIS
jgi:hypothetical protein